MSVKGRTVDLLSNVGDAGPWRSAFEEVLMFFGRRYPTSRTVLSFCRHFGAKLIEREGDRFGRVAVFDTGGRMFCGGESSLALLSLPYYFAGTITGQFEDEQGVVRLLRRLVRAGDTFFDIGANFGFYSSYVLPLCGESGAVHSFEANPSLIPHLRRLSEMNSRFGGIHLNAVAIGKEVGSLPFYGSERIGSSSLYPHEWLNRESVVEVPVITIDHYVREKGIKRIDVVKLDIEGAELDALEGMQETLQSCSPKLIVCELTLMPVQKNPLRPGAEVLRAASAADPRKIADFLKDRGYEIWRIADNGRLHKWNSPEMTTDAEMKLANVAFVRPELREQRPELFADRQDA